MDLREARRALDALQQTLPLDLPGLTDGDPQRAHARIRELRDMLTALREGLPPEDATARRGEDQADTRRHPGLREYVHALWDKLRALEDAVLRLEDALTLRASRVSPPPFLLTAGPQPIAPAPAPRPLPRPQPRVVSTAPLPVRSRPGGWWLLVAILLALLILLLFLLWPRPQAQAVAAIEAPTAVPATAAPVSTPTAAPVLDMRYPRALPTVTPAPTVQVVCANTDVPAFPNATLHPADASALQSVLRQDGTIQAQKTLWNFSGRRVNNAFTVRVFSTDATSHGVLEYFRKQMEASNWVISLHQPEFGYLEGGCSWDSRKVVIGTFQEAELSPVSIPRPGYLVILYE